jgi:hypothetical protein
LHRWSPTLCRRRSPLPANRLPAWALAVRSEGPALETPAMARTRLVKLDANLHSCCGPPRPAGHHVREAAHACRFEECCRAPSREHTGAPRRSASACGYRLLAGVHPSSSV